MKVSMKPDTEVLDEVVVTGYGVQRKASFTGAAAVVGKDVLAKKTDANFVKALEGAVPGIQMNNSTSMPGIWGSIYVRGRGSLNSGTQPLYVIDGMPVDSDTDDNSLTYSTNNTIDPMSSLNPADIESITVLKDAAATAIYGSRAANGVIVVTTKKGAEGKFNINLDIKQGFVTTANNNMDFANAQQTMKLFTDGYTAAQGGDWQENYNYLADDYFGWDRKSSYDWMDAISRKGYYQDYNLNMQGRTGSTGYYVGLGYLNTEGLIIGSDLERFSGRLNLDTKFKWATLGVNSSYSYTTQNGFSLSTAGSMSSPLTAAVSSQTPMDPFYDSEGNYANINNYNPLALMDEKTGELNQSNTQMVNLNPYFQIDFGKGIYAKTTLGVNINELRQYQYWSALYNPQAQDYNGLGQQYNSKSTVVTWNNIIGWNYKFADKHDISLMLGQEMQKKSYFYEYYAKSDFPFAASGMRDLTTAGTDQGNEYYKQEARLASYFADVHYSYADKYYLSGSFRRDGSSVFGTDNRWGNFWSVGGKWRISGEEFLSENEIITNATLRASYGTVGNQDISWYAARGFYSSGYNYNQMPGMRPTSIPNPELTWEVSKKFDIGFDLSFLQRIHLTFDFYNEETSDALFEIPLSMTTGISKTYQNIGSIRNRGLEIAISSTNIRNKHFTWTTDFNISFNRSKVLRIDGENEYYQTSVSGGTNSSVLYRAIVGHSLGEMYGYKTNGVYTTDDFVQNGDKYVLKDGVIYQKGSVKTQYKPGDIKYVNTTGQTDDKGTPVYNSDDMTVIGNANPDFTGGFKNTFSYKGFDLSVFMVFSYGNDIFNMSTQRFVGPYQPYQNMLADAANRFTLLDPRTGKEATDLNRIAELNPNQHDLNILWSIHNDNRAAITTPLDRFVEDGSYLRISTITLGYTFPKKWLSKAFISNLRLYCTLNNPFTITNYSGYDPEVSKESSILTPGIDDSSYPRSKGFVFGINLSL